MIDVPCRRGSPQLRAVVGGLRSISNSSGRGWFIAQPNVMRRTLVAVDVSRVLRCEIADLGMAQRRTRDRVCRYIAMAPYEPDYVPIRALRIPTH